MSLLESARGAAPFELKYPRTVPAGLALVNVIWVGPDPEDSPDSNDFSVGYWFADGKGDRLHVWQTNVQALGASDPTLRGEGVVELIGADAWIYEPVVLGDSTQFQLSRRFPDGILVSVDYSVDGALLREIASGLR